MVNSYAVEFSKSSRGKCKQCKEVIQKGDIRVVTIISGEDFDTKQFRHPKCFPLPRAFATAIEFFESVEDRTGGEILPSRLDSLVETLEANREKKKKGNPADEMIAQWKAAADKKKSNDDEPKKKKAKTTDKKQQQDDPFASAYSTYASMKNDDLKDILRYNRQVLQGTKAVLIVKCVDGHVRGRLAPCPECEQGKLKISENDPQMVQCAGWYNEDESRRVECFYQDAAEKAPRLQPWFTEEPSEEEQEAMDNNNAKNNKAKKNDNQLVDTLNAAFDNDNKNSWNLTSKTGIRTVTKTLIALLRQHNTTLPADDAAAQRKVGPMLLAHKHLPRTELLQMVVQEFAKDSAKAQKKKGPQAKCPDNQGLVTAFQELAELYFQQGNRNAGGTYTKLVGVVREFDFAVTEENALGLGKGKTKMTGVGKASAEKMLEFCKTGTMQKLEEKRLEAA